MKLYIRNDYYSMIMTYEEMVKEYCGMVADDPQYMSDTSLDEWISFMVSEGMAVVDMDAKLEADVAREMWKRALATDDVDEVQELLDEAEEMTDLTEADYYNLTCRLHIRSEEITNNEQYFKRKGE
jgi:hypothetical protein